MTWASMPRALRQRASQKPSRPASKATAMRSILRPAFSASSRHRCSSFSNALSSTASFFKGWRSTPGTIPATSQLDRLISMTAISVPSGSRAVRDRLRSFNFCMGRSIGSRQRRWNAISSPPPHSIFHHGSEDEAEQSLRRRYRLTNGRSKRTNELTSSIVPRGTSFHRSVELECPPIEADLARLSCRCRGLFPGSAELSAVNPDAVHDHGQPARQRDDRLFPPAAPGDLHRPGLEPGPFLRTHHGLSCFVEHRPHHLISTARYSAVPIDLARLILGARQPKHRPDGLGFAEASRNVDGSPIGQRHYGANAGGRHQALAHLVIPDDGQQAAMQDDDLFSYYPSNNEHRFDQNGQVR